MATSGDTFFSRPMEEEWEFFKKLSKGSKTQASVDRNNHTSSANFVSNQHGTNSEISELSKKVDLLLRNLGKGVPNVSQVSHDACSMCGDPSHSVNNCQNWGAPSNEEGGDSSNFQQNSYQQRPQQYQNHGQGSSNGQQSNVDQKFDLILSELAKSNQGANLKFESLSKSVVNLERQMGQLAEEVHKREAGKLPSYPTLNPKHKPDVRWHWNMVTSLRSGKTYNNDIKIPSVHDFSHDVEDFVTDDEIVVEGKKADNVKSDSELLWWEKYCLKKALLDLGASINILPASLVDKYDLGTLRKTDTIISLADRSTKIPRGILEDVIVDVIDEEVQKHTPRTLKDDPLDFYLTGENEEHINVVKYKEIQVCLDVDRVPSTIKLKPLPSNLKYAFLGPNNTLPVIVASDLSGLQEEALLNVLSKYKAAVGWTIADLKGISPSL
ncbi:hypothetical protein Tco_0158244 [Tanacetum coccineum]